MLRNGGKDRAGIFTTRRFKARPVSLGIQFYMREMKRAVAAFCLIVGCFTAHAQKDADLFGRSTKVEGHGFVISVSGNFDIPAADMAKRFGLSYRVGPALLYKTKSNWMFGVKFDFLFGDHIKDDSIAYNIKDADGNFYNAAGTIKDVAINERGYATGVMAGKIIPFNKAISDNGLLLLTGVGFIQHKVSFYTRDRDIPQLFEPYVKGYDRLTNGLYVEQFVGYSNIAPKGLLNYQIGFNFLAGFTQGRRDFQYDLMRADNAKRLDILFGLRGAIYIPVFKRKSDDIYFE